MVRSHVLYPIELQAHYEMEHSVGAAPTHSGFADRRVVCFTTNAWCWQMGLNHRRSALQADALPTELYQHKWYV